MSICLGDSQAHERTETVFQSFQRSLKIQ